ncbi:MAG: dihydrofolate reductase [Rickettsiales bacterium]|jgi:dihydrofolate reductase|nr:dihydrofolate reductase [Rickettsiales bacterium]
MAVARVKFPEINLIIAMTESGLIGSGGSLPWKSRIDLNWFKKWTVGWPVVFGRKTAASMPVFPLRNRPCAIVSNKGENNGPLVFSSIHHAIRHFQNFDKIFIAGGSSLYNSALRDVKLETNESMIDVVIKTEFPDGYVNGDTYLDKHSLSLISEEFFSLVDRAVVKYFSEHKMYLPDGKMPDLPGEGSLDVKDDETLFPWIKFEIWKRRKIK